MIVLTGLLWGLFAAGDGGSLRTVEVDAANVTGTIRSLQGVNGEPVSRGTKHPYDVRRQYRDLRIDLVRLHDCFGPVDIDATWPHPDPIARSVHPDPSQCVFPHPRANPEQPASYNWAATDRVVAAVVGCGALPLYRIGRSWGADPSPPADFNKFADIVKHVVMHYNDGWGHGFRYKIRYWEFWNEPNLKETAKGRPFWSGTPEQFYRLYEKVARTLKAYDPELKVGAPAIAFGGYKSAFREGLIDYCGAHQVPLDFYSWHHYTASTYDPYDLVRIAREIRRLLDAAGLREAEEIVDEWNMSMVSMSKDFNERASIENGAYAAAALSYMQDAPLGHACIYRGDAGAVGMFERDGEYRKTAYAFKAMGLMLDTPQRLSASGADTFGFAVVAGRSADNATVQVLLSNYEIPERFRNLPPLRRGANGLPPRRDIRYENNRGYALTVRHLPWGSGKFTVTRFRTTANESWAESHTAGEGETLEIRNSLPPPGMELIVIRRQPR